MIWDTKGEIMINLFKDINEAIRLKKNKQILRLKACLSCFLKIKI